MFIFFAKTEEEKDKRVVKELDDSDKAKKIEEDRLSKKVEINRLETGGLKDTELKTLAANALIDNNNDPRIGFKETDFIVLEFYFGFCQVGTNHLRNMKLMLFICMTSLIMERERKLYQIHTIGLF